MSTTKKKAPPKTPWLTQKGSACGDCYGSNQSCRISANELHRIFEIPEHEAIRICAAASRSRYTVTVTNIDTKVHRVTVSGRRFDLFEWLAIWLDKTTDHGWRHFYIEYR